MSQQLSPEEIYRLVLEGVQVGIAGAGTIIGVAKAPSGAVVVENKAGETYELTGSVDADTGAGGGDIIDGIPNWALLLAGAALVWRVANP